MSDPLVAGRLALAAVLALAAIAKLRHNEEFRTALAGFGVPAPWRAALAVAVPSIEAAVAVALIPVATAPIGAFAAVALLALFTVALALGMRGGRRPECRCFGRLAAGRAGPTTLLRNGVLAALGAWIGVAGPGGVASLHATAAAAMLVALVTVAAAPGDVAGAVERVAPGTPAPRFRLCDLDGGEETLGSLLTGHRALLLVFSDIACPACTALFPRVAAWQRAGGSTRVVLVLAGRVPAAARLPEGVSALVDVDGIVARSYGVRGTPSAVVVRADATVQSTAAGAAGVVRLAERGLRDEEWTLPRFRRRTFVVGTVRVAPLLAAPAPLAHWLARRAPAAQQTCLRCSCDGALYEDVASCQQACRVSLGCFTGICEPAPSGSCQPPCPDGGALCGNVGCCDPRTQVCENGECVPLCPPGTVRLAQGCADPCEQVSRNTDPLARGYINQYTVGQEAGLPTSSVDASRGANACGVSSLVMAINALKARAGGGTLADSSRYPDLDLRTLYEATASARRTGDGVNSGFAWAQGDAVAQSLGYDTLSHGFQAGTAAFVDSALDSGAVVVVSTTFSRSGGVGGGHVVSIRARTPEGNYIVDDPAGDQNVAGGYGRRGTCGYDRSYPRDLVRSRIEGRPALAILPTRGADPRVLVILAPLDAPNEIWIQDGQGRRTGWTRDGVLADVPGSAARLDPIVPSDPAAPPAEPRAQRVLVVSGAPASVTLEVSRDAGSSRLRLMQVENAALVADRVLRDLTAARRLHLAPPRSRFVRAPRPGSQAIGGIVVATAPVRRVSVAVRDEQDGVFLDARGRRSTRVRFIEAAVRPGTRPNRFRWSTTLPPGLVRGREYFVYVSSVDVAGNREVAVRPANAVTFTA